MKKWLKKKITRARLNEFIVRHATDKKVLDLGSSKSPYAHLFPNRTSFDIEEREGVDVVGDAHNMPFKNGEFEVIVCTEVLEHLHSPHIAIEEMQRVLKPGGKIILTTRFVFPIHDAPHDYYRYTEFGMKFLFRNGWTVLELKPETRNFETIAVQLQRVAFQTTMRGGLFTNALVLLVAKIVSKLGWLIKSENGINSTVDTYDCNIFASGYYLVATKN